MHITHFEVILKIVYCSYTIVPERLLHFLLEMQQIVCSTFEGGLRDRKRRSILCWVWIIIPLSPNIIPKVSFDFSVAASRGLRIVVLAAGLGSILAKGLMPDTPMKAFTLVGMQLSPERLVTSRSDAILKMKQLIYSVSMGNLEDPIYTSTSSALMVLLKCEEVKAKLRFVSKVRIPLIKGKEQRQSEVAFGALDRWYRMLREVFLPVL